MSIIIKMHQQEEKTKNQQQQQQQQQKIDGFFLFYRFSLIIRRMEHD